MAKPLKIILDLPPKELSPNHTVGSRGQRMGKAAKIKKYRQAAAMMALSALGEAGWMSLPLWDRATVQISYYHKTRAFRDPDNIIASMKAGIDGLTDAGVFSDDRDLTYLPVSRFKDASNPRVEIEITPAARVEAA